MKRKMLVILGIVAVAAGLLTAPTGLAAGAGAGAGAGSGDIYDVAPPEPARVTIRSHRKHRRHLKAKRHHPRRHHHHRRGHRTR
jgi:hypothetical protein